MCRPTGLLPWALHCCCPSLLPSRCSYFFISIFLIPRASLSSCMSLLWSFFTSLSASITQILLSHRLLQRFLMLFSHNRTNETSLSLVGSYDLVYISVYVLQGVHSFCFILLNYAHFLRMKPWHSFLLPSWAPYSCFPLVVSLWCLLQKYFLRVFSRLCLSNLSHLPTICFQLLVSFSGRCSRPRVLDLCELDIVLPCSTEFLYVGSLVF